MSTVSAAGPAITSQPTTKAPSRANARAVARPMLPPVPVTTQTFPASRPGISLFSVLGGGSFLGLGHAHQVGVIGHLVEVPVDDVESRSGQWPGPVPEH